MISGVWKRESLRGLCMGVVGGGVIEDFEGRSRVRWKGPGAGGHNLHRTPFAR